MPERRVSCLLALVGLFLTLAAEAQESEEPRIGSIDIESENVFGPEDTSRGFLYRGANALHPSRRDDRLDAAYAFQPDPAGHRGWLESFAAGQAF